jgi:Protein of unknown function (DUF3429)
MTAFSLAGVPRAAVWLGFGGLVPFWLAVAAMWANPQAASFALSAQLAYGAVILSFLGGVHWGRALAGPGEPVPGWSVVPALLGWLAAAWMEPAPALILLIVGFWAAFIVDMRAVAAGRFPGWYLQLRRPLSALVVLALAFSLLAVWS